MIDAGFYSVTYQGKDGWGMGMIVLAAGQIYGADVGGGLIDGTYRDNPESGILDAEITWTATSTMPMVHGVTVPKGYQMPFKVSLSRDVGIKAPAAVQTPLGPLTIILTKARDAADAATRRSADA